MQKNGSTMVVENYVIYRINYTHTEVICFNSFALFAHVNWQGAGQMEQNTVVRKTKRTKRSLHLG